MLPLEWGTTLLAMGVHADEYNELVDALQVSKAGEGHQPSASPSALSAPLMTSYACALASATEITKLLMVRASTQCGEGPATRESCLVRRRTNGAGPMWSCCW